MADQTTISAASNIIVDDDNFKDTAEKIKNWSSDLDGAIETYLNILEKIKTDAIIKGDTKNKLDIFKDYADYLKAGVADMGEDVNNFVAKYIDGIDEADEDLYEKV